MKNSRIIQVKFLGPTTHLGPRISLKEVRHNRTDKNIISCNSSNIAEDAIKYLEKIGIKVVGKGWIGVECIVFSDSWSTCEGFINIKGKNEV